MEENGDPGRSLDSGRLGLEFELFDQSVHLLAECRKSPACLC